MSRRKCILSQIEMDEFRFMTCPLCGKDISKHRYYK